MPLPPPRRDTWGGVGPILAVRWPSCLQEAIEEVQAEAQKSAYLEGIPGDSDAAELGWKAVPLRPRAAARPPRAGCSEASSGGSRRGRRAAGAGCGRLSSFSPSGWDAGAGGMLTGTLCAQPGRHGQHLCSLGSWLPAGCFYGATQPQTDDVIGWGGERPAYGRSGAPVPRYQIPGRPRVAKHPQE
ncbi:uncharacterized protein ACBT57_020130 [Dama dama]